MSVELIDKDDDDHNKHKIQKARRVYQEVVCRDVFQWRRQCRRVFWWACVQRQQQQLVCERSSVHARHDCSVECMWLTVRVQASLALCRNVTKRCSNCAYIVSVPPRRSASDLATASLTALSSARCGSQTTTMNARALCVVLWIHGWTMNSQLRVRAVQFLNHAAHSTYHTKIMPSPCIEAKCSPFVQPYVFVTLQRIVIQIHEVGRNIPNDTVIDANRSKIKTCNIHVTNVRIYLTNKFTV